MLPFWALASQLQSIYMTYLIRRETFSGPSHPAELDVGREDVKFCCGGQLQAELDASPRRMKSDVGSCGRTSVNLVERASHNNTTNENLFRPQIVMLPAT